MHARSGGGKSSEAGYNPALIVSPTVLIIGLGDLGATILELLAREPNGPRIVVASRNRERGISRTNLARLGAMAQGCRPQISFEQADLTDRDSVWRLVERETPDVVLGTATLQTWWLPDLLAEEAARPIKDAGFGIWLPVHLTLTMKLMEKLRDVGYRGRTITAPFPDVINCVLDRIGLAPTSGIGNLDEVVPKIRLLAAQRLGVPLEGVRVFLVAHHALEGAAFGEPMPERPPYYLRIEHGGQDVTDRVGGHELLFAPYPIPPGRAIHFLTAGSAVRLIRALLSDAGELLHAPAPNGLPGGYPVIASSTGVQPAPLEALSLDEAISINERSHRFDGVERIEPDGTVVFVERGVALMREAIGYDCPRLRPDESEGRALELMARFSEYASRHGVDLNRVQY
jgi:hypothetical protein